MEISRSILNAVRTGRVYIGAKSTSRAVMFRRVRLVVLAENAPKNLVDSITYYCKLAGIPIYIYRGSSIELGRACGKPFPVSALGIRDPGDSDVFELLGVEPR